MRRHIENWLIAACDPQPSRPAPRGRLTPAELTAALAAAKDHFVLGAVLQSAASWGPANDDDAATIESFRQRHLRDVGRTLALRQLAEQTVTRLGGAGIPCSLLKGEDFARRLYPAPALRTYRDVDLLVPVPAYRDADRVIQSLGFTPLTPVRKYAAEDYGQISYVADCAEQWSVELHWNLINSPAQRQQCSVTWDDFDFEPEGPSYAGAGLDGARRLSATSVLLLATVHACVGHRFDSLQQLCDIRQICRGAAGAVDVERLCDMCRRFRAETPVAWSLELVARIFACPEARQLAEQQTSRSRAMRSWRLLGRRTVLAPHSATSKLRRSWARARLKHAA
jgi:hypothetical protein